VSYNARKVYQDELIATQYDSQRFQTLKGRITHRLEMALLFRALRHAGIKPPAKILDVPCGTGRLGIFLSSRGYSVTGMDLSKEMIAQALSKEFIPERLTFQQGDAENLPLPDQAVDAIVSLRFMGHVPPEVRHNILAEFKRVSRGPLILAYYQRNCFKGFLRRKRRQQRGVMWFPVTRKELEDELAASGLVLKRYWPMIPFISETLIVEVGQECI